METVSTEWIVIDGAPSSGKTTLLRELHRRGLPTIPEIARTYVELELALGRTLVQIRGDPEAFERHLLTLHREQMENLDPHISYVLDGAPPRAQAYIEVYRMAHMPDVLPLARMRRYKHVFLCDPLPFEEDHVRTENAAMAAFLDRRIEEIYRELGYDPVRVPVMPVEERAAYVLENLPSQDRIARQRSLAR